MPNLAFGIDLITFFHPAFWGLGGPAEVVAYGQGRPGPFWTTILDTLAESGTAGIELTFSPFGWEDTLAAFGSAAAFRSELDRRGLSIASGFFADVAIGGDLEPEVVRAEHIRRAGAYADYLAAMGAGIMVMGLPMRASRDAEPPRFVDLDRAKVAADFCNRLGAEVLRRGVRLALHTEAHSMFSHARDVDLMMLLTDPVYVHFCPDLAHLLLAGADPIAVVERHKERMIIAHWKDAAGPAPANIAIDEHIHESHRPYFRALGAGRVDWVRWSRLLRDMAFAGWAILEIDAAPDPGDVIRRSMGYVRSNLLPIYS